MHAGYEDVSSITYTRELHKMATKASANLTTRNTSMADKLVNKVSF